MWRTPEVQVRDAEQEARVVEAERRVGAVLPHVERLRREVWLCISDENRRRAGRTFEVDNGPWCTRPRTHCLGGCGAVLCPPLVLCHGCLLSAEAEFRLEERDLLYAAETDRLVEAIRTYHRGPFRYGGGGSGARV